MMTPLLVTGMFRSGTTLLGRMLQAHPRIAFTCDIYLPFFHSFRMKLAAKHGITTDHRFAPVDRYFYPTQEYYFSSEEAGLFRAILKDNFDHRVPEGELAVLRDMIHRYGIDYSPRVAEAVGTELRGDTYEELFRCMVALVARSYPKESPSLVGFKDVWPDEFVPAGLRTFPELKVIQILRDPRAVCASKRASRTRPYPWLFLVRRWRKHALLFWLYSDYPNSVLRLRYEELVAQPEATARRVCAFLGVEFHVAMVTPSEFLDGFGRRWIQNSTYSQRGESFTTTSTDRWVSVLSEAERFLIETTCRCEMQMTGYGVPSLDLERFRSLVEDPPVVPYEELSPWVQSYPYCMKAETVPEMKRELARLELATAGGPCDRIESEFLVPEMLWEWRRTAMH